MHVRFKNDVVAEVIKHNPGGLYPSGILWYEAPKDMEEFVFELRLDNENIVLPAYNNDLEDHQSDVINIYRYAIYDYKHTSK